MPAVATRKLPFLLTASMLLLAGLSAYPSSTSASDTVEGIPVPPLEIPAPPTKADVIGKDAETPTAPAPQSAATHLMDFEIDAAIPKPDTALGLALPDELKSPAIAAAPPPSPETAKTEAAKPETATPAAPTRSATAEALNALFEQGRADRLVPDAKDRDAVRAFYAARNYEPFLTGDGAAAERQAKIAARLAQAGDDGLDPSAYRLDTNIAATPEAKAEQDVKAAARLIAYARHASGGRVAPLSVNKLITAAPPRLDATTILTALDGADPVAALDGFNPPHPGYRKLRDKLVELRRTEMSAPRPDKSRLEADIVANMERWRWLPRELGERHIWVNIPDYEVSLFKGRERIHKTRVIVGRAQTQTPVFSDMMQFVVVNPSWHVPPSILKKEMGPAAQRDPGYFARRGYQVLYRGRPVDASKVNWSNPAGISIRQPPSERNALGRLKFMFPNSHSVYLHDTPNRSLFAQSRRSLSHGCVRVHQPEVFAEEIFRLGNPDENWTQARLRSLYGGAERRIDLKQKLPVHLVYFTVSVDDDGQLVERDDIYGHNVKVRQALVPRS